jgi:hypothetical protein
MKKMLDALRAAVAVPPKDVKLSSVVPVFVPDSLATPQWPGPVLPMKVPGLAVTWAALMPGQTMLYVTHEMAARWSKRKGDWRTVAAENLASLTPELSSHSFARKNGEPYGLVMLHEDGIGPSRLLLEVWLEEVFPDGYSCAIPERSCGIVLADAASKTERAEVLKAADTFYRKGSSPMLKGFFRPDALRPREDGEAV